MKDIPLSSHNQPVVTPGRRDFICRSLLAGSSLLLVSESRGDAPVTQADDSEIAKTVGLADSIALYGGLLEDARRLVVQKDVTAIYVAKADATSWLAGMTSHADQLRALLERSTPLTDQQRQSLRNFLSDVEYGGKEIREGLIRMRQEPLEQLKNLDTDFDKIRATLAAASTALKNGNTDAAKANITAAIAQLNKYQTLFSTGTTSAESSNAPARPPQAQQSFRPVEVRSSKLIELLQAVLALLNSPSPRAGLQHHSTLTTYHGTGDTAFEASINSVLRSKLKPGTWLQIAIGYGVAFPILLRVSDQNNRLKLLNDALRLVPPGLRDPLLAELAHDLAALP